MAKTRRPNPTKALAEALEGRAETETDIAESLGMTVEQLRHIEAGRRKPTLNQAVAIEDHLSIPVRSWSVTS